MKNNGEKREKPDGAEDETLLDPLMVIGEPVPVMELEQLGSQQLPSKSEIVRNLAEMNKYTVPFSRRRVNWMIDYGKDTIVYVELS